MVDSCFTCIFRRTDSFAVDRCQVSAPFAIGTNSDDGVRYPRLPDPPWCGAGADAVTGLSFSTVVHGLPSGPPGPGYAATSDTLVTVASAGSIALTTQSGLAYIAGTRLRITSRGSGAWVEGVIASYTGALITFTADLSSGSGDYNDWNLSVAGQTGPQGAGYTATSATSLSITATAARTFATQAGLAYQVGTRVRVTSRGTGEWMEGVVTQYVPGIVYFLTIQMDTSSGGSATHADWNISVSGQTGTNYLSTGDAVLTLKTVATPGFVIMDDGTIGSATSGATTRANADCEDLFTLLWNNISDSWAPVVGGRGASASADWGANKQITLTRQLGRAIAGAGAGAGLSTFPLGSYDGAETSSGVGSHDHTLSLNKVEVASGPDTVVYTPNAGIGTDTLTTSSTGASFGILSPRAYWNVMIKL